MKTKWIRYFLAAAIVTVFLHVQGAQVDIPGPVGSGSFGTTRLLSNGNFIVTDPDFDDGATIDVGAVYFYSPTGALISTLKGSKAGDRVGSGSVVIVGSSYFLVRSPLWDNGGAVDAGAVTWGSGTTGFPGGAAVVSASNSLVGSKANDQVGLIAPIVLFNGNYIVATPLWDNGAVVDAGAVTWGNGTTGIAGVVSASNSLVGSKANDQVGNIFVFALFNGNYVVISSLWDNGAVVDVGAITWGNGVTGTIGVVSVSNSLVGSSAGDQVGDRGVTALFNGNYVVVSSLWNNGAVADAGAVTWSNGLTGLVGTVSASNSLVGSSAGDQVGSHGVTALFSGNYVVASPLWNNGAVVDAGAVTWGNGVTGTVGTVSASNSLVGSSAGDMVGDAAVATLQDFTNGSYVVLSPFWDNGAVVDVGAVTWGDGTTGVVGTISASNSLVGSSAGDVVGLFGVIPLSNGNYVVLNPFWNNGAAAGAGAVTWGNGKTGVVGAVSASNSLVGSKTGDQVGVSGLTALNNGNYVVRSVNWDNGAVVSAGAVTWGNGKTGVVGEVSASNSLVGSTAGDQVGSSGLTVLNNGNYVVRSASWDNGAVTDAGAVTWANGTMGMVGAVSASNSLVGSTINDQVGVTGITALGNGNYVVRSARWDNGAVADAGAVTWGNGTTGMVGKVSASNSLVGSAANDQVGVTGITALGNGNYVVRSARWDNGAVADAGAVTWGNGMTGVVGAVSPSNSLVGSTTSDQVGDLAVSGSGDAYTVRSSKWDNGAVVDAGAATQSNGTMGIVGVVSAANSVLGTTPGEGSVMLSAFDAIRQQLLVGRPASNIVSILTKGAGQVSFSSALFTVNEEAGVLNISLVRTGGADGAVSVNLSTSSVGGTATAGADYTAIANLIVNFPAGVTSASVPVTILAGNALSEANETFSVIITGAPGVIGSVAKATVRIVDPGDMVAPANPVIISPGANAHLGVNPGGKITVAGKASDNKGIAQVRVRLIQTGSFSSANLTNVIGTSAVWSVEVTPVTGINTIEVFSTDTRGNVSATVSRSFVVIRPLVVNSLLVDVADTATLGASSLVTSAPSTTLREVGKLGTVVAKAPPGFLFASWVVSGATAADIGVTEAQLELPALSFVFKESLLLTARFVVNPYLTPGVAGKYNGVIHASSSLPDRTPAGAGPEDGTSASNNSEGGISVTVLKTGAFTGKLSLGGLVLPVAGTFDHEGAARFGTVRNRLLSVPRAGTTSVQVALQIDIVGPTFGSITGTVSDLNVAESTIVAELAPFSLAAPAPAQFLGPGLSNGVYTVGFGVLPAASQPGGITTAEYPQGTGIGNVTLTKAGAITLAGLLADGTVFTNASSLTQGNQWFLFTQLYNKKGLFKSSIKFDTAGGNNDFKDPAASLWVCPMLDRQHYPLGWSGGILVDVRGCLYSIPAANSVLPGLPAIDANGNAILFFIDGLLSGTLSKPVAISTSDTISKPLPVDSSFSLSITRSNGRYGGTFTHTDGSKPTFQGIILQKGVPSGFVGTGFFRTVTPAVKDYTGQVGGAIVQTQ